MKKFFTLLWLLIGSVMCVFLFRSVRFSMQAKSIDGYDKALIIGRLDTLKALQVAYRSVNGHYAADFNTLADFAQKARLMGVSEGQSTNADTALRPLFDIHHSDFDIDHLGYADRAQKHPFVFEAAYTVQSGDTLPYFDIATPEAFGENLELRIGNKTLNTIDGNWR